MIRSAAFVQGPHGLIFPLPVLFFLQIAAPGGGEGEHNPFVYQEDALDFWRTPLYSKQLLTL
jgi:hypothetical protein